MLVQFGGASTAKSPLKDTLPTSKSSHNDGADDSDNNSSGSDKSSASSSSSSPVLSLLVDGASDSLSGSSNSNHFFSRSASPGPATGSGPEDLINSPFQYGYSMPGSFFPERSPTPQACV